jgi:hypothetical protein
MNCFVERNLFGCLVSDHDSGARELSYNLVDYHTLALQVGYL